MRISFEARTGETIDWDWNRPVAPNDADLDRIEAEWRRKRSSRLASNYGVAPENPQQPSASRIDEMLTSAKGHPNGGIPHADATSLAPVVPNAPISRKGAKAPSFIKQMDVNYVQPTPARSSRAPSGPGLIDRVLNQGQQPARDPRKPEPLDDVIREAMTHGTPKVPSIERRPGMPSGAPPQTGPTPRVPDAAEQARGVFERSNDPNSFAVQIQRRYPKLDSGRIMMAAQAAEAAGGKAAVGHIMDLVRGNEWPVIDAYIKAGKALGQPITGQLRNKVKADTDLKWLPLPTPQDFNRNPYENPNPNEYPPTTDYGTDPMQFDDQMGATDFGRRGTPDQEGLARVAAKVSRHRDPVQRALAGIEIATKFPGVIAKGVGEAAGFLGVRAAGQIAGQRLPAEWEKRAVEEAGMAGFFIPGLGQAAFVGDTLNAGTRSAQAGNLDPLLEFGTGMIQGMNPFEDGLDPATRGVRAVNLVLGIMGAAHGVRKLADRELIAEIEAKGFSKPESMEIIKLAREGIHAGMMDQSVGDRASIPVIRAAMKGAGDVGKAILEKAAYKIRNTVGDRVADAANEGPGAVLTAAKSELGRRPGTRGASKAVDPGSVVDVARGAAKAVSESVADAGANLKAKAGSLFLDQADVADTARRMADGRSHTTHPETFNQWVQGLDRALEKIDQDPNGPVINALRIAALEHGRRTGQDPAKFVEDVIAEVAPDGTVNGIPVKGAGLAKSTTEFPTVTTTEVKPKPRAKKPTAKGAPSNAADTGAPKPVRAYHGSESLIDKFDTRNFGTRQGRKGEGGAFWFTSDGEGVGNYGHLIHDVDLNFSNPLVIDRNSNNEPPGLLVERAKAAGHDALVIHNIHDGGAVGTTYAVWDPSKADVVSQRSTYIEGFKRDPKSDPIDFEDPSIDRVEADRRYERLQEIFRILDGEDADGLDVPEPELPNPVAPKPSLQQKPKIAGADASLVVNAAGTQALSIETPLQKIDGWTEQYIKAATEAGVPQEAIDRFRPIMRKQMAEALRVNPEMKFGGFKASDVAPDGSLHKVVLTEIEKAASIIGADPKRKGESNRQYAERNQKRVMEATKGYLAKSSKTTDESLARVYAHDAHLEITNNPDTNALGWYERKISGLIREASRKFPELLDDEASRGAFIYAMANTSNGLKVVDNFKEAVKAYEHYKAHGEFPLQGVGKAAEAMRTNFAKWNAEVGTNGDPVKFLKFLNTKFTVKELNAMGIGVSGEHATTLGSAALMMGPKIGGGFFRNLSGHFSDLTVDRWLMRTYGRTIGVTVKVDPKLEAKHMRELRDIISAKNEDGTPEVTDQEIESHGFTREQVMSNDLALVDLANKVHKKFAGGNKTFNALDDKARAFVKWMDGYDGPNGRVEGHPEPPKFDGTPSTPAERQIAKVRASWDRAVEARSKGIRDALEAIDDATGDYLISDDLLAENGLSRKDLLVDPVKTARLLESMKRPDPAPTYADKRRFTRKAKGLDEYFGATIDAPTANDRARLRRVFSRAQEILKKEYGIDIDTADLQAVLWYPEQRLWDMGGNAVDYEGAAKAHFESVGPIPDAANTSRFADPKYQVQPLSGKDRLWEQKSRVLGEARRRTFDLGKRNRGVDGASASVEAGWASAYQPVGGNKRPTRLVIPTTGDSVGIIRSYKPAPFYEGALATVKRENGRQAVPTPVFHQIDSPEAFHRFLVDAKKSMDVEGLAVDAHDVDFYRGNRNYLSADGSAGFSITPDGDVVSVVRHSDSKVAGLTPAMMQLSIDLGGRTLDAFDIKGKLPSIYQSAGWKEVARTPFNDEFAPKDWDYESLGRPDIVFMVADTTGETISRPKKLNYVNEWDEGVAAQQAAMSEMPRQLFKQQEGVVTGAYDQPTATVHLMNGKAGFVELVHEYSGHWFETILRQHPEVSASMKKHYPETVAGKERFARHVERYFETQKPPVAGLKGVFQAIGESLRRLWTRIVDGKMPDDVRKLFDRIEASDDPSVVAMADNLDSRAGADAYMGQPATVKGLEGRIDMIRKIAKGQGVNVFNDLQAKGVAGAYYHPTPQFRQGRIRMKETLTPDQYADVLAHEVGHAIDSVISPTKGRIPTGKFEDLFGTDDKADITTIKAELKTVTHQIAGEAVAKSAPGYYYSGKEMWARFLQLTMHSPAMAESLAPRATELLRVQAQAHPLINDFLRVARNESLDVPELFNITPIANMTNDLRQTHNKILGSYLGSKAYDNKVWHRAERQRIIAETTKMIEEKFANVKDSPDALFDVAEGIRGNSNGVKTFGTTNRLNLEPDQFKSTAQFQREYQTLLADGWTDAGATDTGGFLMTKERWTPEEAEANYEALSPEGKKLIDDYTEDTAEGRDLFNRETLKAELDIKGNVEGWVHHGLKITSPDVINTAKAKLRTRTAGAAKRRMYRGDTVKDLKAQTTRAIIDGLSAKAVTDFANSQIALIAEPVAKGGEIMPDHVRVFGSIKTGWSDKPDRALGGKEYQVHKDLWSLYGPDGKWNAEATEAYGTLRKVSNYWQRNILSSPDSMMTNLISGGMQLAAKWSHDFILDGLTLDGSRTAANVKGMYHALTPKAFKGDVSWVYGGGENTYAGQFAPQGPQSTASKVLNAPSVLYQAIEGIFKNAMTYSEMDRAGGREMLRDPRIIKEINDAIDLYAFDYDNIPLWLTDWRRDPVKSSIKPFITYGYKYHKMLSQMIGRAFEPGISWQERVARLGTIAVITVGVGGFKYMMNQRSGGPDIGEAVGQPETADQALSKQQVNPRGRQYVGKKPDGRNLVLRTAKYPFASTYGQVEAVLHGKWDDALDITRDQVGSVGPIASMIGSTVFGLKGEYDTYKDPNVVLAQNAASFIPWTRPIQAVSDLTDPVNRKPAKTPGQVLGTIAPWGQKYLPDWAQREARTVKIPVTEEEIGDPESVRSTLGDDAVRQINSWENDKTSVELPTPKDLDLLALRYLTGVNLRAINPEWYRRVIARRKKLDQDKADKAAAEGDDE